MPVFRLFFNLCTCSCSAGSSSVGTKTPSAGLESVADIVNLPARLAWPLIWPAERQAKRLFIRPEWHHIGDLLKLGEDIRR